jgi:hypothetical protein
VLDRGKADAALESFTKQGDEVIRLGEVAAAEAGGAISFSGHLDLSWPRQ